MDASEIYSKRLTAKEVIFPKQGEFIFPIADGRIKILGGDQDLRTSTLVRHRPIQGESNIDFLGESEGSLPPPQDLFPDAGEAINEFWSMSGSFIFRHHVETRVKLYSPREESFPFILNTLTYPELLIRIWMSSKSNASMIIGISMDQEMCLILGQVSLSSLSWKKNLPTDFCGPGEIDEQAAYIQDRSSMARTLEINGKERQAEGESKSEFHLENARKLRGIYFIDREDTEFKETIKNARKKLETSVAPAMPCKLMKNCGSDGSNKIKTKLACILEASESTRLRL